RRTSGSRFTGTSSPPSPAPHRCSMPDRAARTRTWAREAEQGEHDMAGGTDRETRTQGAPGGPAPAAGKSAGKKTLPPTAVASSSPPARGYARAEMAGLPAPPRRPASAAPDVADWVGPTAAPGYLAAGELAEAGAPEMAGRPVIRIRRSGIYTRGGEAHPEPAPYPSGGATAPDGRLTLVTEELRVDVDGLFPTMTVSGTVSRLFGGRLTWIARAPYDAAAHAWIGPISYGDGTAALIPQSDVAVVLKGGFAHSPMTAHVTYSGGSAPPAHRRYRYRTGFFREAGIEYDTASDATSVTSYDLYSHPNH